jgi:hypothetical protein
VFLSKPTKWVRRRVQDDSLTWMGNISPRTEDAAVGRAQCLRWNVM